MLSFARTTRIIRIVRLLRLVRMQEIVANVTERIQSETLGPMLQVSPSPRTPRLFKGVDRWGIWDIGDDVSMSFSPCFILFWHIFML